MPPACRQCLLRASAAGWPSCTPSPQASPIAATVGASYKSLIAQQVERSAPTRGQHGHQRMPRGNGREGREDCSSTALAH